MKKEKYVPLLIMVGVVVIGGLEFYRNEVANVPVDMAAKITKGVKWVNEAPPAKNAKGV